MLDHDSKIFKVVLQPRRTGYIIENIKFYERFISNLRSLIEVFPDIPSIKEEASKSIEQAENLIKELKEYIKC